MALVALLAAFLSTSTTRAAVLAYEPFDYPESLGTGLNGLSGGMGFSGAWTDANNLPNLAITNTSLLYPSGVQLSPAGSRVEVTDTAVNDPAGRGLATTINLGTGGQEFYSSALFRRSALTGELTSVLIDDAATTPNIRWYYGIDTNGFFSTAVNPSEPTQRATSLVPALPDTTYLLVAKIRTNTGPNGNDEVFLRVFAEGSTITEPIDDSAWDLRASGNSGVTLSRFRLSMSNVIGQSNQFDEFRVGNSFADVVGVPEPGVAASALLGMLAFARRRR